MSMQRLIALVSCLAAFGLEAARGAEINFEATVDRTRVGEADPIQFTLTITADESIDHLPAPKISLKDFGAVGPQVSNSSSRNIDLTRGVLESTYTRKLIYTLYAKRTGTFVLGPARLEVKGETYLTKALKIQVVKGSLRQQRQAQGGVNNDNNSTSGQVSIDDNLFLEVQRDSERIYVGQQLTLDYELFYRFQLHNVGFKEIPTYSGFWVEELYVAQKLDPHRQIIDGVEFNVDLLRQVALFPTSAGTQTIEPLILSCDIATRSRNRFDSFLGRSTQSVVLRAPSLEIEVLSLPAQGRPKDFSGAVGVFDLRAAAQPRQVPVGDPVTLQVEIGGEGHLAGINAPDLAGLAGFKVYEPKVEESVGKANGRYTGRRMYEYILIAEEGGNLEIPALQFVYFNPRAEAYEVARTEPMRIFSRGEVEEEAVQSFGLSRKDIQKVGQDIRYIKPDIQKEERPLILHKSGLFWSFQALLPLVFLGLLLLQRHQRRLEGDVAYARRRRARGEVGKRLHQARQLLPEEDSRAFHAEIQRGLLAFVADHLNLAAAGLSADSCAGYVRERGVDGDLVDELQDLLSQCELARFAATRSAPGEMEAVQERAEKIIAELEGVM